MVLRPTSLEHTTKHVARINQQGTKHGRIPGNCESAPVLLILKKPLCSDNKSTVQCIDHRYHRECCQVTGGWVLEAGFVGDL